MSKEQILNTAYEATVLSGLAVGYKILARHVLNIKTCDLGKLDVNNSVKLVAIVSASLITKDILVSQVILPEHLTNKNSWSFW